MNTGRTKRRADVSVYVRWCIVIKTPPFEIKEEGWGEFDMEIVLTAVEKGGDYSIAHDLNFQSELYESKHVLVSCITSP